MFDTGVQVAEKGETLEEGGEERPSGAKAHVHIAPLTARLKPCPFKAAAQHKSLAPMTSS
jgi:hypothetical protein